MLSVIVTWYVIDRDGLIVATCEAGVPNLTHSGFGRSSTYPCAVLGSDREYFGLIRQLPHGYVFTSSDLRTVFPDGHEVNGATLVCDEGECLAPFARSPEVEEIEVCGFGLRLAGATTKGRLSANFVNRSRILVVDRITEMFAPPSSEVEVYKRWQQRCSEG
ncbi:hypothetical protein [Qipengyuania sp.]|uniref:hypothetical protein n=1 Tax=Qipengyuania sp. TaxID=2004515 RepID=UPI003AF6E31A